MKPLFNRFLFFSALTLFSCSNTNVSPQNTLTTAITAPVSSLNPLYATDANTQHINELTHSSLVAISEKLIPEPYLAESFSYIDPKRIKFVLRKNCTFASGKPITSKEVIHSWEIYTNEELNSPYAETLNRIKKISLINDYEFILETEKAEPGLLTDLAILKILDASLEEAKLKPNSLNGVGPYTLEQISNSEITLKKSSVHNCIHNSKIPYIKIKVIRDDLSRYLKLVRGEIDIILNDLNYRKVDLIEKDQDTNLVVLKSAGIAYSYLGLNFRSPKLANKEVRKALELVFDIPKILHFKSKDMATQARNLLADTNYYANLDLPIINQNLELAKKHLDNAGYFNGENNKPVLTLELKTTTNMAIVENAKVLAAQAKKIGIDLKLRAFEWGIFYNDVKSGNSEIYSLRWVGVTDPRIYYEIFHSTEQMRNNRTAYNNKRMDSLLEKAEGSFSMEERKKQYLLAQEIIREDIPYINLWHNMNVAVFRKNVSNIRLYPNGGWKTFLYASKE
ncbi:MAG: ABC transporter substrate-binding protein [Oligoflexia bacterium]|nr:ABC transporter substrate-binding protein [Oligoflexia bacterium]